MADEPLPGPEPAVTPDAATEHSAPMVSGTEDPVEPGGGGTPPASAGSLASRRPQARRPEFAQRRSPTPGTTRDEAMLEMETQIADLDGKLFASERSARRLASEVAALRLALESTEEAQEAVALDMQHIRKDLKNMMQRIDDGMKEVVEAAVAAAREATRLDAFARSRSPTREGVAEGQPTAAQRVAI